MASRLDTVARGIDYIFIMRPPDRTGNPAKDGLADAAILIQALIFNAFVTLDNLAWV